MLVSERMTRRPITVPPDEPITEALALMHQEKIRRLPVVDKRGNLVGIVAEKDLLYASPSPATTLSVYEMHYLLARVPVREVMTERVITVEEDVVLEEAARIMADNKIGALPVLHAGRLVGIITETDIFKTFVEMLGAREKGLRLSLGVPDRVGMLAALSREIANLGGNIVALGTFRGEDPTQGVITVKVQDAPREPLLAALEGIGIQVRDVRGG